MASVPGLGTVVFMSDETFSPELDRLRFDAVRAEVAALVAAAKDGTLDAESLEAAMRALGQIPFDPVRALDAVHLPADAGVHAEGLGRILARIPSGWGRWIGCGAGWYPLLVRLEDQIARLAPEFEIYQVKEKYGTLRFYWGFPVIEPRCCVEREILDPRPAPGAVSGPFAPKDRPPQVQALLEAWLQRVDAHFGSAAHRAGTQERDRDARLALRSAVAPHVEALITEAEEESARTCERCSAPAFLQHSHGWFATLCGPCGESRGFAAAR